MAKREDINETAFRVVQQAIGELPRKTAESKRAQAGRKGGLRGGNARAKALTKRQRSEIAKRAAQARWGQKAT